MNEQELRHLKSGLYNANSALQHLITRVSSLEQEVSKMRALQRDVAQLKSKVEQER